MKKLIIATVILTMICTMFANTAFAAPMGETKLPATDKPVDKTADDRNFYGFYGRLSIPDADIDVALYSSSSQTVCDRKDSACIFPLAPHPGQIIADHCNQDFSTLTKITVDAAGQIILEDGSIVILRCAEVFDGHNTGYSIVDANWNSVLGEYPYLTYTCINGWQNIRICLWEIVEE